MKKKKLIIFLTCSILVASVLGGVSAYLLLNNINGSKQQITNQNDWSISLKNDKFSFGNENQLPSITNIDEIKNIVLDRKNDIFNIPYNLPIDYDWKQNIVISKLNANDGEGELFFYLKINKSNNENNSIYKKILFNGYKKNGIAPPNPNQTWTIIFKNSNSYQYGDNNLLVSDNVINEDWIKQKVIENKNNIFDIIQNNINLNDSFFNTNISINNITKDLDKSSISFTCLLNNSTNTSTNPISKNLIFTGFKNINNKLQQEIDRVNNLNLFLKQSEYSSEQIFAINNTNILDNINYLNKQPKFNYVVNVNDFIKEKDIILDDQIHHIRFRITISDNNNSSLTKEFDVTYKFDKTELEAERIQNLSNNGLELINKDITKLELDTINANNILQKIKNLNLDTNLFIYEVSNLRKENNNISFDLIIKDKNNANISFEVNDISVAFNLNMVSPPSSSNDNEQILNNCEKSLIVECSLSLEQRAKIKPSDATSFNNVNKYFSFNEQKIKELGGSTNGFVARYDNERPTSVFIIVNIWVGTHGSNDYVEREIIKEFNGFKSEIDVGFLDSLPNPHLTTPDNAISWKGKIGLIDTNKIGSNAFSDKINKFNWDNITKEFIYQARFILYQSFKDNFSEINYYSLKDDSTTITVIAEGIIKDNEDREFWVQTVGNGSNHKGIGNVKTGDKIKITFTIPKVQHTFNMIDVMGWSFVNDCNLINSSNTRVQFGIVLPGYQLNITNNNKNIYSFGDSNKLRTYCFSIGRTKNGKA